MVWSCRLGQSVRQWVPCVCWSRLLAGDEDGLPVEHGVEGRHLIDPHGGHFQQLCHVVHHADARPSLVLALAEVEQWNDGGFLVLSGISGDDFVCPLLVASVKFKGNLQNSSAMHALGLRCRRALGLL